MSKFREGQWMRFLSPDLVWTDNPRKLIAKVHGNTPGELEANAQLIETAPELLAALEKCLLELETVQFEVRGHPALLENCKHASRESKAAIAKAKGIHA